MFEKGVHIYSRPQLHLYMTASGLIPCIQALRGLAEQEAAASSILHCIDCLASQAKSSDKQRCQLEEEVVRLRADAKKLRSRTRKLENQLCRCTNERDQLASHLQKAQDIHRDKIQQLTRLLDQSHPINHYQRSRKDSTCSQASQCQIWTESTLAQLQERTQMLLHQVEDLQQLYDQQTATTCARDAQIEELLLVLQNQQEEQMNPEEEGEKENDNSTLDDNSEKGQDCALPEWLENVHFEPSESMEADQQQDQEGDKEEGKEEKEQARPGWVRSLLQSSYRFCSFILG